ncbi:PREDICTED: clathrin heavy chain linker domain-containing protein 1-like isoform X1 [Amphimedon queenslandica]|uniref:Translin-associated factor X-interacting protein 1 N-terminal domain-containing protein n=1 Tax=Amphimedon queenslandica TaxID=400682 RepID=A0AAN0JBM2_AMPQE|nr:PREDICTED: clathrin heavy chain linker domain-containing protein 1-like isoform X1 [Amphimedon queenslandica]|eukprot:XP_019854389.1 PREDICTED: clathrin heavy chain linker domain-containing protein 1-like isoform X1 [Amphimedon queenslandica]
MADRSLQVSYVEDEFAPAQVGLEEFGEWQRRFDQVIEELPAYGPTLAKIKKQYEAVIGFIIDSKRVRALVQLDREKRKKDKQSILNFKRRKAELEEKILKLSSENKRLKKEIDTTKDVNAARKKEKDRRASPYHKRFPISSADRRSLSLTPSEAINIQFLEKELARLKLVLDEVQYNTEKRYVPKNQKDILQQQLINKEKEKEKIEHENKYLCHLYLQLRESIKAARLYYSSVQSSSSGQDHVVPLSKYALDLSRNITMVDVMNTLEELGEQDPEEEKEAEFILHCCQKFNELFDTEQFTEAALIAATSPKGVLRTIITLNKFKSLAPPVSPTPSPSPSPLMTYCSALMDSAHIYPPVSTEEAMECLYAAVAESHINLIAKWISKDSLPLCKEMGSYLYKQCSCPGTNCRCQFCMLSLVIYKKLNCSFEESLCLAKLGKYSSMLKDKQYNKNDIASLLSAVPSVDHALFLVAPPTGNRPSLHLFEALYVLAQTGPHPQRCIELVKSFAVLRKLSWQEAIGHETRLRPDLAHNLIPVLSQFPELDWLVLQLSVSYTVYTVLLRAIERINRSMSESSMNSSSYGPKSESTPPESRATSSSSRPKLTRSKRFDADDGTDFTSRSTSSASTSSDSGTDSKATPPVKDSDK